MATTRRRINWLALILAIVIEGVLVVLAVFGGPHGALGGAPWVLQLPGILIVLFVPGEGGFLWRVAAMVIVQVGLWYALLALLLRRKSS